MISHLQTTHGWPPSLANSTLLLSLPLPRELPWQTFFSSISLPPKPSCQSSGRKSYAVCHPFLSSVPLPHLWKAVTNIKPSGKNTQWGNALASQAYWLELIPKPMVKGENHLLPTINKIVKVNRSINNFKVKMSLWGLSVRQAALSEMFS